MCLRGLNGFGSISIDFQAAKACCIPSAEPSPVPGFDSHQRNRNQNRKLLQRKFRSVEEALFLSGVFSTTGSTEEPGGATRSMPLFEADKAMDRSHGDCTKYRAATGALSPGLMVCGLHNCVA